MIWKTVLVAMQVAGIFGAINLTPEQKQSLHTTLPWVCEQSGAGDKAAAAEAGVLQFVECLGELYDYDNITQEMMSALNKGTLRTAIEGRRGLQMEWLTIGISRYCEKSPQVKKCLLDVLERVMPCAPPLLQVNKDVQSNAADKLLQLICSDKGDKIALFMIENGKQCVAQSVETIRDCTRDLKSSILKQLDIKTKCTTYDDMSNCVLGKVLVCESKATAVLFKSMFEYIRDISPCKAYVKPVLGELETLVKKE